MAIKFTCRLQDCSRAFDDRGIVILCPRCCGNSWCYICGSVM